MSNVTEIIPEGKFDFSGTIVITDPCYFIKKESDKDKKSDWEFCDKGTHLEKLGFKTFAVSSTIYGNWSCNVENINTSDKLGKFSSDSGLVGVFLLSEILKYNPDYNVKMEEFSEEATVIDNFNGSIRFDISDNELYTVIVGDGNISFVSDIDGFSYMPDTMIDVECSSRKIIAYTESDFYDDLEKDADPNYYSVF